MTDETQDTRDGHVAGHVTGIGHRAATDDEAHRTSRHRSHVIVCGALAIVFAAALAAPAGAHRITVTHGSKVLVRFHAAECYRDAKRHFFSAVIGSEYVHKGHQPDFILSVAVNGFSGFHAYPLIFGPLPYDPRSRPNAATASLELMIFGGAQGHRRVRKHYSNSNSGPTPPATPSTGKVTLSKDGRLLRATFGPAMFADSGSDSVAVSGMVPCTYN